jgi:YbbR domain-containing protein
MKRLLESIKNTAISIFTNRDHVAKIASLVLAVVLWAYISGSKSGQLKYRIPIEVINLPKGVVVSEMSHRNVLATIEGKNEVIKNLNVKNLRVYVDLSSPEVGEKTSYEVRLNKNEIPEGVTVSLNNRNVLILAENIARKTVKVVPKITGNIGKGSVIGKIDVVPEQVTVSGPESRVSRISFVYTRDISIEEGQDKIISEVKLNLEDMDNLKVSRNKVNVTIPIINYGDLYNLDIPIEITGTVDDFEYQPETRTIKVYFKARGEDIPAEKDFAAKVDVSGLKPAELLEESKKDIAKRELPVSFGMKKEWEDIEIVSYVPEKIVIVIRRQ